MGIDRISRISFVFLDPLDFIPSTETYLDLSSTTTTTLVILQDAVESV